MGIALGVMAALWLPGPVWLKVFVGVLLAGVGLAVGLGRVQGVWRVEEVLIQAVRYRLRSRRMVWRRRVSRGEQVVVEEAAPPPVMVPADERAGFGRVRPPVDLWWGLVSAFVLAMMSGVTAYLAGGGL